MKENINYPLIDAILRHIIIYSPVIKSRKEIEEKTFNILKEIYPFIGESWKDAIIATLDLLLLS